MILILLHLGTRAGSALQKHYIVYVYVTTDPTLIDCASGNFYLSVPIKNGVIFI